MRIRALFGGLVWGVVQADPESVIQNIVESTTGDVADQEETCGVGDTESCPSSRRNSLEDNLQPELNMVDSSHQCTDKDHSCPLWAELGECQTNQDFMLDHCALSCKSCLSVTRSYGKIQKATDFRDYYRGQEMHRYMTEVVMIDPSFDTVKREVRQQRTAYIVFFFHK